MYVTEKGNIMDILNLTEYLNNYVSYCSGHAQHLQYYYETLQNVSLENNFIPMDFLSVVPKYPRGSRGYTINIPLKGM